MVDEIKTNPSDAGAQEKRVPSITFGQLTQRLTERYPILGGTEGQRSNVISYFATDPAEYPNKNPILVAGFSPGIKI